MVREKRDTFLKRRERFLTKEYKSSLRQVLSYLDEHRTLFIILIILGVVQSLLFLLVPLLLGPIMDILVDPNRDIMDAFQIFLLILVIQGIVAVLFAFRIYINRWIGANIIYNLRNDLFATIQIMSFGWLDENKTGELISRTTSDVNNLKEFLGGNLQFFFRQLATFIFSFVVLFFINWKLAFWVVITSPALFYILFLFRKKLRPIYKKSRESYADLTHTIQENVQGISVVKAFAREEYEVKKFKKENDNYFEDSIGILKLQATFDPVIYLIDNIAFLIVILLGGLFVIEGDMTFGQLFSFVLIMNFSVEPLYFIARFLGNMPQISENAERIAYILNSEVIVKEKKNPIAMPPIRGAIEFKNVNFSFLLHRDEENYYVLKDINFKVEPGENIAILGPTGSGKSALVKLIPRFYDVSKGEILIDGINIKDVSLKSLRKQIGYVSQNRILFSRTIKENIAFGDKALPLKDIQKAAIASDIHSFIEEELPEKYDTKIGEQGKTVSGGQKQRLAIARALAIKPKILILDDATSAVDVDTEYAIQKHFEEVFKDCTTFLITQRLSSVRNADRILILDAGRIVQMGTHEELLREEGGIYKKLYETLRIEERA
ncbi:MAG: ABC transporter ATP-binding protein [Promethearchaeota archaeon]